MINDYISFSKIDDGFTLRISFTGTEEDKLELEEMNDEYGEIHTLWEITEGYWANGWGLHTADQLGQLSECLIISEDSTIEDDGRLTLFGKCWSNVHNYQTVSVIEELLEKGFYEFYLWEDFGSLGQTF